MSVPLEYAQAPRRRGKWVRRGVLLVMILAAVVFSVRRVVSYWQHRQLLHWQSRCMKYRASPEMVVYEDDPAAAEKLLLLPEYARGNELWERTAVALHVPRCRRVLERLNPGSWAVGQEEAVLFMHERRSSEGVRKLVIVSCDPRWDPSRSMPGYLARTLERPVRPGWDQEAQGCSEDLIDNLMGCPTGRVCAIPETSLRVRYFAGQPDARDESHFTIRYEMAGGRGTIDGWLQPDGRGVRLEIRDGPAAGR